MGFWRNVGESLGLVEKVNRNSPGAVSRDVALPPTPPANNGTASGFGQAYGGPRGPVAPVTTGTGADWLGPQNPILPVAPPEVEGRRLDFPVGYNLTIQPRQYEAIGFQELRALAESLDVLRLVIETRKDQMAKLEWSIQPVTNADGSSATKDTDPAIKEIQEFFQRPDGVHNWGTWLRMLLEDLFVVDAPTLYCERTRGGKLLRLKQIDGATIKVVIDDWGDVPAPPVPAYQEVLKGFPAVNYTADEMIYAPRNPRAHKIYGLSPVEQIVVSVNIALRRQLFQLDYYTDGSMPEALIGTPKEWTPQQIAAFQKDWDAMLAGNLAMRRRAKFIPGDVGKNVTVMKEPDLTGHTDEWLARVVCFCFSISPQPFVSMMNRATAETAHDAAIEEGLQPLQQWVKDLVDGVIRKFWKRTDIEFAWADDREVDAQVQEAVLTSYVKTGVQSINEVRDVLGLKPVDGGEIPRVMTATGFVLVTANDQAPDQAAEAHDVDMKQKKAPKPAPVIVAPGATPQAAGAPSSASVPPGAGAKSPGASAASEAASGTKGGAGGAKKSASAAFRKAYWPTTREAQARRDVARLGGGEGR